MDVHEYLGVLRRGLVFIVLGVVLGLLGGAAVRSMEVPAYSATARDLVTNQTSGDLTEWLQASTFTESRIASYVLVASSGLVLEPVIDELALDTSVEDLARQITVTAPPQTFIIEITATAASPELARDIANAVSAEFSDVVSNQLETTDGDDEDAAPGATPAASATPVPTTTKLPDGTVVPVSEPLAPVRIVNIEEAVLPTAPLPSNGGLLLIVGGVLGLAAGLLAASLREAFDTRVRGPKDIAAVAQIPILGDIPADRAVWTTPLVTRNGAGAPIAEAFRGLRAHIDYLRTRDGRRSFVITAAEPGQGATIVAANLAVALANTATSIVVVDADLRSSALSRLFGIHGAHGLTEVLAGRSSLDAALHSSDGGRLTVLPAGARPSNPGELLATPAARELLAELRRRFDVVLIDAPSISEVTDAAVLGSFDSATLLVLAEGATTRPRLADALSLLASGGSAPVGIVLNAVPRRTLFGRGPTRRSELPVAAEAPAFVPRFVPQAAQAPVVEAAAVEPAAAVEHAPVPVASKPAPAKRESPVKPEAVPAAEPAIEAAPMPTTIEHSLSSAKELDFAFAALPTATADEQRAGSIVPEIEQSRPAAIERRAPVERPIVVRPDPPRPASRFAPDPAKLKSGTASAYASAPAPSAGTHGRVREPALTGTVVNTVSIRIQKDAKDAGTIPPPIRHILPTPTSSTIPPKVLAGPPDTADTADLERERARVAGSLLGEIGGLPRVEVRAARQVPVTDSAPNPERQARERYELRARELERAAHDRLMREQQRLAVDIREQLAHDKRELESVLDNRLEDTVLRPVELPPRRAADPRFSDPRDDDGATR